VDTATAISISVERLKGLAGHSLDVLDLKKPDSVPAAVNLAKIISKLSPILGNLIESTRSTA